MEKIVGPNGLRILLYPIEGAHSASVGVWVYAGSRYENTDKQGISHFVEHMLFKGTETRTARQISEEMDNLGGGMNAYTTKEYTRFYAQTLPENSVGALELIGDMLLHSRMDAHETELERRVILDEMAMYEDEGEDLAHELLCAGVWPDSPLGRPIIGTKETVAAIRPDDLLAYVRENYTPERLVVVVAGCFDRAAVLDAAQRLWDRCPRGTGIPAADTPAFTPGVFLRRKKFEQLSLEWAVPGLALGDEGRYALMLFNFLLGGGASSRLFQRVREQLGLVYSIYSTHYASRGAGLMTVGASMTPANQQPVLDEVRRCLEELADGAGEEEFRRAKVQVKASFILGLETVAAQASYIGRSELMENRVPSVDEEIARIDAVTPDEVNALAERLLTGGVQALSGAGPVAAKKIYIPYISARI